MTEAAATLPPPRLDSTYSLERSLKERRSIRAFSPQPLTLPEVSQLLWAAQGITGAGGLRTAPSAGALYPLEVYLVVGQVQDLAAGVYHYRPDGHRLIPWLPEDKRAEVATAAFGQSWLRHSAVIIVFTAVDTRTTGKYGDRGIRYIALEAGHAGQNVLLQATALGLGAVVVGAFNDPRVDRLLNLPSQEHTLYLLPVGRQ
jgi:SagB-type dehydrogenase family enzyme